ncbi:uncharacterized protein LOC129222513 [Uloborus diversus]|uniref:uncharacterized protein LOC129222513 n=1 Tax=Uloborus diversus TaxID=327109 RepID=UPI002409D4EC|nr:uncharacterized protein LOC129222513 [Uloborus diversus]
MNNLEKIKKKRASVRAGVSRIISKVEPLIKQDPNLNEIDQLNELYQLLEDKGNTLKDLDAEIDALIVVEKDYEEELISCEEYNDRILSYKFKIKNCIRRHGNNVNSVNESSSASSVSSNTTTHTNIKLPKLNIEKFNGDTCLWLEFFNVYESAIHLNPTLNKLEKFSYLKTLLSGPAFNCVSGFALNESNYDACINILKDRYGRKDLIINSHMNKLLNLEPVRSSSNILGLRNLYDQLLINIRNLDSLNVASGSYGHLLNPIVLKLLPEDLTLEFHRKRASKENFEVTELIDFIKNEVECRETAKLIKGEENIKTREIANPQYNTYKSRNSRTKNISSFNTAVKIFCIFCNSDSHPTSQCLNFTDEQKRRKIRKESRCFKCFRNSHIASACRSKIQPCEICESTDHDKLFCSTTINPVLVNTSENQTLVSTSQCNVSQKRVLLQTCIVNATSSFRSKLTRILLDCGSEKSFITKRFADELKLRSIRKEKLKIYSFGNSLGSEEICDVFRMKLVNNANPQQSITVEVLGTDVISGTSVLSPLEAEDVTGFMTSRGWSLSDSTDPSLKHVNVLLGADYFWKLQLPGVMKISESLFVCPTIFGLTVVGQVDGCSPQTQHNALHISTEGKTDFDLQSFWKLESIGIIDENNELSISDSEIIESFRESLKYSKGRYVTKLQWKMDNIDLKDNFSVARRRFLGLKNKLKRDETLLSEYKNIITEQIKSGIVEPCKYKENGHSYYMPHRPVIRSDKETTKIRIVFDASSKDKDHKSLNECLISGPNLNPNILDLILRFRIHKIAFSADIEKAFHQIVISEEDRDFLRFFWFDSLDGENSYELLRMSRVTFGVTSSSFILSATLKYHIEKYKEKYAEVFNMLDTSLYVDDLFYGADSDDQAFSLSSTAVEILKDAGMKLRKFKTNSSSLKNLWEKHGVFNEDENVNSSLKVLGVRWDTDQDNLQIDAKPLLDSIQNLRTTKRSVLQMAAKVYDPAGFISPFVIRIKILMQELWELGIDWDEKLPFDLENKFNQWCSEIEDLLAVNIPRLYPVMDKITNFEDLQIFVFCDASLRGYGAVSYFRDPESGSTSLILSKSRVSPLKRITLPRLELMGAILSSRIVKYLKGVFGVPDRNIFCFSDSQIVLHWIKGSANNWKPFVANRVREIQDVVAPSQWGFCKGEENPADLVSRGCKAAQLQNNEFWFHGPKWMREVNLNLTEPEKISEAMTDDILKEQRKVVVNVVHQQPEFDLLSKFSSWTKLKRVVAYCLRFAHNTRSPSSRLSGFLSIHELENATKIITKIVQERSFEEEIKCLKGRRQLNSHSKILSLNPFLDNDGILRVGGRLRHASISEEQKHQIILPRKHSITDLIVKSFHENHLHGSVSLTVSAIRQRFWIINCREAVRRIIWKCIKCFKNRSSTATQIMADLPSARVTPARVFARTGVDFAGPFMTKFRKGRGIRPLKTYVCLFICFSTKAIHLETVSDLTSEAFLASLKRFAARRGKPQEIFSDRGTNFIKAEKELKEFHKKISLNENVNKYLTEEAIQWKFNPPSAPHFGGLWEAGVKQMKAHLKRTVGAQVLTQEEFLTLITQIESCLNSRPIVAITSDPNDLSPLTPGHFIIGAPLTAIPEPDTTDERLSYTNRWKLTQQLFQSFWKRWHKDYLCQLQGRSKWTRTQPNLKINDLVIIKEDNTPPLKWRLGRIVDLFPGSDELVRVVKVKTALGELKRPISKLAVLPTSD